MLPEKVRILFDKYPILKVLKSFGPDSSLIWFIKSILMGMYLPGNQKELKQSLNERQKIHTMA